MPRPHNVQFDGSLGSRVLAEGSNQECSTVSVFDTLPSSKLLDCGVLDRFGAARETQEQLLAAMWLWQEQLLFPDARRSEVIRQAGALDSEISPKTSAF